MGNSENSTKPYQNESLNLLYDLLFCDNPELFKTNNSTQDVYPWSIIFSANASKEELAGILNDEELDARLKVLAHNKLKSKGQSNSTKDLLGVIIEVALDEGLDVLAAYSDGRARYINYSEKLIVWESPNETSNQLVQSLLAEGSKVVKQIGPWEEARLPYPPTGNVRLTFLVSDQIYFGQGPIDVLFNDPMGGPVLDAATQLMQFLTDTEN